MSVDKKELENMPAGTDFFSLSDQVPTEEELYDLAELFKVFGDSTRIKILYVLVESGLPARYPFRTCRAGHAV